MTYRIPSPWDAGYAVPGYMKAEGLQTRAFVTKQMPRGTYDHIADMNTWDHGYAIPQYIKDEGYGQGAKVTYWPPRGYYVGTVVNPASMKALPPVFTSFGVKAATATLRHITRLPVRDRKPVLIRVLNAIDPTLWNRTEVAARRAEAAGVPATKALHAGLSHAMSTGITAEVINLGHDASRGGARKTKPKQASLLGLGCYGCGPALAALGLIPQGGQAITSGGKVTTVVTPPDPQLQVGPWVLSAVPGGITQWPLMASANDHRTGNMPADQVAAIAQGIAAATAALLSTGLQGGVGTSTTNINGGWSTAPVLGAVGSGTQPNPGPTRIPAMVVGEGGGWIPIYKFTHPVDGKRYGLYLKSVGTPTAPVIQLSYKYDPGLGEQIWNGLVELVAVVLNVVKDVLTEVGSLACGLINTGAASAGATVAGGPAGAAGVSIAQQSCGQPQPTVIQGQESLILPLAIAGGVVLTALFLSSKKKAP